MILRSNKKRVYESPEVKQTGLWLEALICHSIRVNGQADEIHNIDSDEGTEESHYIEF